MQSEQLAIRAKDTLEQVYNITGFFDGPNTLAAHASFPLLTVACLCAVDNLKRINKEELKECVKASCCLVLFVCDEAINSEWVQLELATAKRHQIDIIAVVDQDRFVERELIDLYVENDLDFVFAQQSIPYRCCVQSIIWSLFSGS